MAFIKVDWERLKASEYPFIEQIDRFWDVAFPDIEGDELLVFKNTYNDQYCVYWKLYGDGERMCLAQHVELLDSLVWYAGDRWPDEHIAKEMIELVNQKADDGGFPKSWHDLPHGMTWRELADEILKHPELLDETAYVWTPNSGMPHDDFTEINGITPYDADASADGENFLSINLRNW